MAVDGSGNVYVADAWNDRIQKFDSDGNFLTKWGTEGDGDGQFMSPSGVAVDGSGSVYVADTNNGRIQKFDSEGNFLTKWGTEGSDDGQFRGPHGVAVDGSGNVYVADAWNDRIQKFDSEGNFLTKWGTEGSDDGQFRGPHGVAVDGTGNVYVTDTWNYRIQKFRLANIAVEPRDKLAVSWGNVKGASGMHHSFALRQNYPNPFNPETWIPYQLGADSDVTIRIYSITGRLVRLLDLGYRKSGSYVTRDAAAYWDGRTDTGERVSSGVFFYTIQAGDYTATKKMAITK